LEKELVAMLDEYVPQLLCGQNPFKKGCVCKYHAEEKRLSLIAGRRGFSMTARRNQNAEAFLLRENHASTSSISGKKGIFAGCHSEIPSEVQKLCSLAQQTNNAPC